MSPTEAAQAVVTEFETWRNDTIYRWGSLEGALREFVFSLTADEARAHYQTLNAAPFEVRDEYVAGELLDLLSGRVNYSSRGATNAVGQALAPEYGGKSYRRGGR